MKVIIAGSRSIKDYSLVEAAVAASGFAITEVVSGVADGVDRLGENWAMLHGVPITRFFAQWSEYGKRAGLIRNAEMGEYADALIAVTTGSSGTQHMINYMQSKKAPVFVYHVEGSNA